MSKVNIYISIISNPSHTEQVPERNVDGRDGVDPHPLAAVWWIGDGFGGWGMGDGGVMRGTRQRIWHAAWKCGEASSTMVRRWDCWGAIRIFRASFISIYCELRFGISSSFSSFSLPYHILTACLLSLALSWSLSLSLSLALLFPSPSFPLQNSRDGKLIN